MLTLTRARIPSSRATSGRTKLPPPGLVLLAPTIEASREGESWHRTAGRVLMAGMSRWCALTTTPSVAALWRAANSPTLRNCAGNSCMASADNINAGIGIPWLHLNGSNDSSSYSMGMAVGVSSGAGNNRVTITTSNSSSRGYSPNSNRGSGTSRTLAATQRVARMAAKVEWGAGGAVVLVAGPPM